MNELLKKLQDAKVDFENARLAACAARGREVEALNRLNQIQREFDEHVKKVRDASPADSDWGMERKRN